MENYRDKTATGAMAPMVGDRETAINGSLKDYRSRFVMEASIIEKTGHAQ